MSDRDPNACVNCAEPGPHKLKTEGHFANEPEGTTHFACSEACQKHANEVMQGIKERKQIREEQHACPFCSATLDCVCGGPRSYWIECSCGVYTHVAPDINTLRQMIPQKDKWNQLEEGINMYPPLGG